MELQPVDIFSDGSYTSTNAIWGYICYDLNNIELFRDRGILKGEINKLHQVGGEMYGVMEALRYCKKNNYVATLYVDFKGLISWVSDVIGRHSYPAWKCKNKFTAEYRNFIIDNRFYLNDIILVKGHANCAGNNAVDAYCKSLWTKKQK